MVYIHLATGFEEVEAITTCDYLRRAGIKTKLVSIEGAKVRGAHNIAIDADLLFNEADYNLCQAIVLPGGLPGTTNLMAHQDLRNEILKANKQGKLICAICAAPMILGDLGIINGKTVTIYPGLDEKLTGAHYEDSVAIRDGNIITSRGPATAVDFALKIIEAIKDNKASEEIKKDITLY
ncbi:MAG: DJ-1/PfpI family protein [Anaerovoracaceae bacterium]